MTGSASVLVDTSAWIDFFRRVEPCHGQVARLLDAQQVCSLGLVVAELMQGARSEKELAVLRDFVHVFDFLPDTPQLWQQAGELSFALRRSGTTVGLADCFIAVAARHAGVAILTRDHHFALLRDAAGIELIVPSGQGAES